VLVVGGGQVAERRIKSLLGSGASIHLIAPEITKDLEQLVNRSSLKWHKQSWQSGTLHKYPDALVVLAATNRTDVNREIAQEAKAAGRLVNLADDPAGSDFILPAVLHSGEITITISTFSEAATPALSVHLREKLAQIIGPEYGRLSALLKELRPYVKATVEPSLRPLLWRQMVESSALDLLKENKEAEARSLLEAIFLEFTGRTSNGA
jgi:precorrin-2 dehydrogenase/sirohydrochlorin ferrochelatase